MLVSPAAGSRAECTMTCPSPAGRGPRPSAGVVVGRDGGVLLPGGTQTWAVPALTNSSVPVKKLESAEARNNTAVAISRGAGRGGRRGSWHPAGGGGLDRPGAEEVDADAPPVRAVEVTASTALSVPVRALPRPRRRNPWTNSGRRRREMPPLTAYPLVSGVRLGWERRAVKPSAQPTLVRTQHLPRIFAGQSP
jgi:hypothetical protein